jgi:hypothetical protein
MRAASQELNEWIDGFMFVGQSADPGSVEYKTSFADPLPETYPIRPS